MHPRGRSLCFVAVLAVLGIAAPTASAEFPPGGVVSIVNGAPTFTATNGADTIGYGFGVDELRPFVHFGNFGTDIAITQEAATDYGCAYYDGARNHFDVGCYIGPGGVRVNAGAGDDQVQITDDTPAAGFPIVVDGGNGADTISGSDGDDTLLGGGGADLIRGRKGNDRIDGGSENDTLYGNEGDDHVQGGDGNDTLDGDLLPNNLVGPQGNDTLDGGPGVDMLLEDTQAYDAPATMTLDGQANDGRAGEHDNLLNLERVGLENGGSVTGSDGAEMFIGYNQPVALSGLGGNDVLQGSDADGDVITGGAGDDDITGGYGDDTLTGGPGRDRIGGDRPFNCVSGPIYTSCSSGSGNDTIEAVDGEVDSITCGGGQDTVHADAIDVIDASCEIVTRAGGGSPPNPGPGPTPNPGPGPTPNPGPKPGPTPGLQPIEVVCKVPNLKGLTKVTAKTRLTEAHCKLGKASPKTVGNTWVVKHQAKSAGRTLTSGTKINLTFAKPPKKHNH